MLGIEMKCFLAMLVSLPAAIYYSATALFLANSAPFTNWPLIELFSVLACYSTISLWFVTDARRGRQKIAYDFDSLMFFFWPVAGPIYLFRTRRWRFAFPLFVGLALLVAANLSAIVLSRRLQAVAVEQPQR
jgi:hypothetical protein